MTQQNILKIDEVYDLGTDEIRDKSKATYRVMVMDKNFEQMTPIGFAEIKKYEKNPAFGKPSETHPDPSAQYDLCRRSTPYLIQSDLVLVEPSQVMSGRFEPFFREGEWRRRTICCEHEQKACYVSCRNMDCPYRNEVPGYPGTVPVEFVVLHQDRPLMLGQGKFAEGTTKRIVKDMQ